MKLKQREWKEIGKYEDDKSEVTEVAKQAIIKTIK